MCHCKCSGQIFPLIFYSHNRQKGYQVFLGPSCRLTIQLGCSFGFANIENVVNFIFLSCIVEWSSLLSMSLKRKIDFVHLIQYQALSFPLRDWRFIYWFIASNMYPKFAIATFYCFMVFCNKLFTNFAWKRCVDLLIAIYRFIY